MFFKKKMSARDDNRRRVLSEKSRNQKVSIKKFKYKKRKIAVPKVLDRGLLDAAARVRALERHR
jgi:hypothetical protein